MPMAAPPKHTADIEFPWAPSMTVSGTSPARVAPEFSPPLIAMVAVIGTAFLIVIYARIVSRILLRLRRRWRQWRRRRRLLLVISSPSDLGSPPPLGTTAFDSSSDYFLSTYGLDDAAIKSLPIYIYYRSKAKHMAIRDCAVCLFEFEDGDSLRTLPSCAHAFHAECIDAWLRSQASCPLCRAGIFRPDSPFIPMRAARIRPSFDGLLLDPLLPIQDPEPEIGPGTASPPPFPRGDFLLKRSYSFGFERSLAAERLVMEPSTASPWRYRHRGFWSKRWQSPFGGVGGGGGGSSSASRSARVFSFRSYRGVSVKSPFLLRRRGFLPLASEPSVRLVGSRRSRSLASPSAVFAGPRGWGFSSSRMRCGDPEALLSPERLNRR